MPREAVREEEEERRAKTAYDLIRLRLNRLEKNIEKPAPIPARREPAKPKPPPEFVRNVVGSSAAAGSAEFHIFRNNRRKEMNRLDFLEAEGKRKELDEEFERRKREREEAEAARTAKKRKKRLRMKEKLKKNKRKKKAGDSSSSSDSDDATDSEDETGDAHQDSATGVVDNSDAADSNDKAGPENRKQSSSSEPKDIVNNPECITDGVKILSDTD
ncbi:Protein F37A4.2 [Aphelenchoides avenae]|nr:Protein F37A4.2 [Aphelenchus avenae]